MQNISITLSSCNNLKTTMRDVVKTPYRSRISGDFTWTSGIERVGLWFYRRSEFRCKQAAQSRRKSPGSDRSKLEHDTQCRVNVGHRLHHWPNIEPTQGQCSVLLTGKCLLTLVFDKKKGEKNQKHLIIYPYYGFFSWRLFLPLTLIKSIFSSSKNSFSIMNNASI